MKEIKIIFKTKLARAVWRKVSDVGDREKFIHRKIVKTAFGKERIISEQPLTILINPKIKSLARNIQLDRLISEQLAKEGLEKDKDFNVEVV